MEKISKTRNESIDILKGISILFVVFSHTMVGSSSGATDSILFNAIWSIQMPLFMLLSGYVTRYSRGFDSSAYGFVGYVKRKTISYLLPWAVWTFLIRGIIFCQVDSLNLKWLFWHMDGTGYWFLTSLYTIQLFWGISVFLEKKFLKKSGIYSYICVGIIYIICMFFLLGVGLQCGITFLGIKYTLYYMPFYFIGYLYGQFRDHLLSYKHSYAFFTGVVVICFLIWNFIIFRVNLYKIDDYGWSVLLRICASMLGCISICELCKDSIQGPWLLWMGRHSLEVYLIHCLFLNMVQERELPNINTIEGVVLIFLNFLLTTFLTILFIKISSGNPVLRFFLYGKK